MNEELMNQTNPETNPSISPKKLIEFSHVCKYYDYDGGTIKA